MLLSIGGKSYKGTVSLTANVRLFVFTSVSQLLLGFPSPLIQQKKQQSETEEAAKTLGSSLKNEPFRQKKSWRKRFSILPHQQGTGMSSRVKPKRTQ